MSAPRDFDVRSPLERGISLLEASAGTGKTYQITNLVLRLVTQPADPVRMGQLLVVTFTKAATAELIDRIRSRLALAVHVYRACAAAPELERTLAELKQADPSLKELVRAAAADGQLELHLKRLVRAQEEFDQALISTIHGFCQRMLRQNAFESLVDFDLELVQDQTELIEEIVDDYLSARVNTASPERYAFLVDDCGFERGALIELARQAVRDPRMRVDPDPGQPLAPLHERLSSFARWWEAQGMAELAEAFEQADAAGALVPTGRSKSQTKYREARGLREGQALLDWVRSVLAGGAEEPCPNGGYWSASGLKPHSPGGQTWHHPHLDRVRRAADPWREEVDHERAGFVAHARGELLRRHRAQRSMNFHDLLRLLAQQLENPAQAGPLKRAIASGFQAALIDEFQDTDPEQWTIFRTLFGGGDHYLYLIGDPKQAIYAFRGADVNVYLQAADHAGERVYSMRTNYRSDARFLEALNTVFSAPFAPDERPDPQHHREGMFALEGIAYEPVSAPVREPAVRLRTPDESIGSPDGSLAPLWFRFLDARSVQAEASLDKPLDLGVLNSELPRRVAADIVDLLERGMRSHTGGTPPWRTLSPGDIAVLVRKTRQARAVQAALLEAGVPCVLPGADSVLATDEARDLQLWLEAVQSPGSDSAARAAFTTPMFGGDARQLRSLERDDQDHAWWDAWLGQLASWRDLLQRKGVLGAFRAAMNERRVQTTLLAWPDGERRLTNLLHLLELLHAAQVQDHLQLSGLIRWLSSQRRQADLDSETGELRLERDDAAVRILTMHKCKGLQFPVVFAPFLWGGPMGGRGDALIVSEAPRSPVRVLDVHSDADSEPRRGRALRAICESSQEELRLLYVALTRAEQRCVVYTGHIKWLGDSPLGALLHAFPPGTAPGAVGDRLEAAHERVPSLSSNALWSDLVALAARAGGSPIYGPRVHLSRCAILESLPRYRARDAQGRTAADLAARIFRRHDAEGRPKDLDHTWRRTSYTSIARARSHRDDDALERATGALGEVSELQAAGKDHDQVLSFGGSSGLDPAVEAELRAALPSGEVAERDVPLADLRAGASVGTFLHELFEHLDFSAFAHPGEDTAGEERARAELLRVISERGPLHGFDSPRWRELLLAGLPPVLRTPLGGDLEGFRLADVPRNRRLDELSFDLPLAGGDQHRRPEADGTVRFTERISGRDFGQAFGLAKGDPVLRDVYLDKLAKGWEQQAFAGFLTGSIDLVFAAKPAEASARTRYFVADYKSNRLDLLRSGRTPRAHFCQAWMRHEMEHHDYVVQAYLYSLALHRYLRQRLGLAYVPEQQLGGAYYLFVRGMVGPERASGDTHPYGVFFLKPRLEVLERLDELFEGADGGRS